MADYTRSQPPPSPHPFLTAPKIYITQLAPDVTEADLARALESCVPVRPQLRMDPDTNTKHGEIDFKYLASAEKALATLQGRQLQPPSPYSILHLSPIPPEQNQSLPSPRAQLRLIKQLPSGVTDAYLFDLFRPYGPIASISTQSTFGPDIGIVGFWEEEDAKAAEIELHCADIGGVNISVQVYQPRRAGTGRTDLNVAAAPFVPSGGALGYSPASQGPRSLHSQTYGYPASPVPAETSLFHHGPGQQVQFAPAGHNSHSGLIDPCNLFCKNLDLSIDSNDLFNLFKPYGQIVSARVMRGDNGQSRGFGFVSYQQPDQASSALQAMNAQMIRGKQIQVRFHEPKQLRQEKLAQRFADGTNPGNRRTSGSSSPAISDTGEFNNIFPERVRRGSGSYYNAALSGSLNLSWSFEELQSLSPVVRNDVLKGELQRKVRGLETVPMVHMDAVVDYLLSTPLTDLVQGLHDPNLFASQVKAATEQVEQRDGAARSDPLVGLSSLSLVSPRANYATPPLPTSPSPALVSGRTTPASESDRLAAAVGRLGIERDSIPGIIELLLTLPKKERALCLFNNEHLRAKVAEAQEVLQADDDASASNRSAPAAPGRPAPTPVEAADKAASDPAVSQTIVSPPPTSFEASTDSPAQVRPPASSTPPPYTLTSLAALPAKEIIRLTGSQELRGLPLPKADPLVTKSTDDFIDSLQGKSAPQQKQMLGEKLFKVIRAFGIKGAPKLTVMLLDSEDLRALSHLMNSYPTVLKEKVLLLIGKS